MSIGLHHSASRTSYDLPLCGKKDICGRGEEMERGAGRGEKGVRGELCCVVHLYCHPMRNENFLCCKHVLIKKQEEFLFIFLEQTIMANAYCCFLVADKSLAVKPGRSLGEQREAPCSVLVEWKGLVKVNPA